MNLVAAGFKLLTFSLLIPWSGAWTLGGPFDADAAPPAGAPIVLANAEGVSLKGTVDADADRTFKFGERVCLGVIAGGGGWHKPVLPMHFQSDGSLTLAKVVAATAGEVKEIAQVAPPVPLEHDFFRVAGPASQVLEGHPWHVTLAGVTVVGPRIPTPAPLSLGLEVLEWDEKTGTIVAACDGIVEPGMILGPDDRFGVKIVRDVLLEVTAEKIRATLWVVNEPPDPRAEHSLGFAEAIGELARRACGVDWLRLYTYRVVSMKGDRIVAAPEDLAGLPALDPVSVWCGAPGVKSTLSPGHKILVGFRDDRKPYVSAFEPADSPGWLPLSVTHDAITEVNVGPTSLAVNLAKATDPVVLGNLAFSAWVKTVEAACNTAIPGSFSPANSLSSGAAFSKIVKGS